MENIRDLEHSAKKTSPFKQMKIGTRVGLSFAVVLSIFVIASFFNIRFFSETRYFFSNYSIESAETATVLDIDRQVSELQRVILAYSNTGHSGVIRRAKASHSELVAKLTLIKDTVKEKENVVILNGMMNNLNDYGDNIDDLVESREHRDHLLNSSLVAAAKKFSSTIRALSDLSEINKDHRELESIYAVHVHFLAAQVDAVSFLGNRKYALQHGAKTSLSLAQKHAAELLTVIQSQKSRKLSQQLIEDISHYEDVFLQTIEATRFYLFLVNVVMAGEAAEFSVLSQSLKNAKLDKLSSLTDLTSVRISAAQTRTTIITVAAIIVGLVLTVLISKSLSRPIGRIAETFARLVMGDHDTDVPGLDRGDEIGQLAKAANIFKQMSERTQGILKESQMLAVELTLSKNQLHEQTLALRKSNDELDNFAYVASHDLKSPLRAIDNLAKWIVEDCGAILPDESRQHLDKLQKRVLRMENLLSDLLNYSRAGRVDVNVVSVNVVDLVRDVVELIDKPDNFRVDIDEDLPCLLTPYTPLQQVFLNIMTNAVKHNDKDCGYVRVTSKALNRNYVEFSVVDNGPGIAPVFHARIFKMFQTLQSRDVLEGSGMGLAIIKKVIESFGGEIRVESNGADGSGFVFSWPVEVKGAEVGVR